MNPIPNPKQSNPHDVAVAALKQAYEQFGRADEQLTRVDEQVSKLEQDAAPHPSEPQTRISTFDPVVPGDRPSRGGRAIRGFIGFLLAVCIGVAAFVWQSPFYGDAARQIIARWAPQLVPTSSLTPESPGLPAQPSPPTVQAAAAKTAPPQPAPLAQTAPEDVAPTAAALSPELTQLLQSMARDIATLGQAIEQLKASQAQMARDNANAAEQLKASQEQMARVIARASEARASEQNLRPRISAPPPRPTATPTRRPVPTP
jgi:DNA repair exonuclease SbcCD ATPase subunit